MNGMQMSGPAMGPQGGILSFLPLIVFAPFFYCLIYVIYRSVQYSKYLNHKTLTIEWKKKDFVCGVILLVFSLFICLINIIAAIMSITHQAAANILAFIPGGVLSVFSGVLASLFLKKYKTIFTAEMIAKEKEMKQQGKSLSNDKQFQNNDSDKPLSYFDGGLLQLIGWSIAGALVTTFTLGICYPWALCMVYGWKINHTVINGRRLQFNGKAVSLFGHWMLWLLLCIITLGIYSLWLGIALEKWKVKNTGFKDGAIGNAA